MSGANAVVLGRSNIVGMPVALLLVERNATVTICHSRTKDMKSYIKNADILVSAVGRPEMVPGDWIKPGAVIIDVATVKVDDPDAPKGYVWKGDVNFEEAKEVERIPVAVQRLAVGLVLLSMILGSSFAMNSDSTFLGLEVASIGLVLFIGSLGFGSYMVWRVFRDSERPG